MGPTQSPWGGVSGQRSHHICPRDATARCGHAYGHAGTGQPSWLFPCHPCREEGLPCPKQPPGPASRRGPVPAGSLHTALRTAHVPDVQGAGNDKNLLLLSRPRWGELELRAGEFLYDSPQGSREPVPAERSPGKHLVPISKPRASFTAGAAQAGVSAGADGREPPHNPASPITAQHLRPPPCREPWTLAGSSRDLVSANSLQILGGEVPERSVRCAAARIRPAIIICSALIPSLRGSRVLMMTHDTPEKWANIIMLFPASPSHSAKWRNCSIEKHIKRTSA